LTVRRDRNAAASHTIEQVGDCWVAAGETERARAFYRRIKAEFTTGVCDPEGVSCNIAASEELRRIDCGSSWLAPTAEIAWQTFLQSLDATRPQPQVPRVEPDVRVWMPGAQQFAESCPDAAFQIPNSVRLDRESIRAQVASSDKPWIDRSAIVQIRQQDVPWKNYAPGIYRFFRIRACAPARPVVGATSGFFIRIIPIESEHTDPLCESS
jgi:hypothetical protein